MNVIKSFLKPTIAKLILTIILIPVTVYLILTTLISPEPYYPFFVEGIGIILSLGVYATTKSIPWALLKFTIEILYLYVVSCVYVTAYYWIDSMLRRRFPWINAGWEKRMKDAKKGKSKASEAAKPIKPQPQSAANLAKQKEAILVKQKDKKSKRQSND